MTPLSAGGGTVDPGIDLVLVSTDGGTTWTGARAPGDREWIKDTLDTERLPRWVEPLAWDSAGALFSLWSNLDGLWVARSTDRGRSWRTWNLLRSAQVLYYPYLIARGDGELAATWFAGFGDDLEARAAIITLRGVDSVPHVLRSPPFSPEVWGLSSRQEDPTQRNTAGEYLAITFLPAGRIGVVSPIQNERAGRFGFSWWVFQER